MTIRQCVSSFHSCVVGRRVFFVEHFVFGMHRQGMAWHGMARHGFVPSLLSA